MKGRIPVAGGFLLALALILVAGCSKKSNSVAPQLLDPADVNEAIEQAGKLQPLGPDKDVITSTQETSDGNFRYVTESHDASKNIQEITYLGLNDDVIWAGNLIKGAKVHQFVYEPVVGVARNPVTLSINLENSGSGMTIHKTVNDPKLSTVRQAINDLLNQAITSGTTYAARAEFDRKQVYSESQLNLVVGADLKYGAGSLNTKFDWASTTKKNKIIAKYQQFYYTIDMDTPTSPCDVFASSNTLDAVKAAIPPGSCPMYVAGVTYGMMALTFIETDYSESDLSMSLDAAYGGLGLDAEIRSGLTKRQVLANSTIKTVVYGGASAGLDQIEMGYEGFVRVVHASIQLGTASPGVPLLYKFRHLCDNTLAAVTMTSQYAITRIIRLRQMVCISIDKMVCEWANDDCGDDPIEMDRFYVWVNAKQQATGQAPVTYFTSDTLAYSYEAAGYGHVMNDNEEHPIGAALTLWLDAEHYDYSLATISVRAKSRDYDEFFMCSDDWAENELPSITSTTFSSNPHSLYLYGEDYRLRCEVTITLGNGTTGTYAARRR